MKERLLQWLATRPILRTILAGVFDEFVNRCPNCGTIMRPAVQGDVGKYVTDDPKEAPLMKAMNMGQIGGGWCTNPKCTRPGPWHNR